MQDGDAPVDINDMELNLSISSARHKYDELAGLTSSDMTRDEIDVLRPQVYQRMAAEAQKEKQRLFLKVHDVYYLNKKDQPIFPKNVCQGAIYLLRNPLDVAVSYTFHRGQIKFDKMIKHMADPAAYMAGEGYIQLHQRLMTWSSHVESWTTQTEIPTMVVRYEDLKSDTIKTFSNIVEFLGLDDAGNESRIEKAVAFSKFDKLQKNEAEKGFGERVAGVKNFFRSGTTGDWKNHLSKAQVASLIDTHKLVMQKFGYSTEPEWESLNG